MILVLAGTSDGRRIVERLLDNGYNVLVSTATEYGGRLIEPRSNLVINSERLGKTEMIDLAVENKVKCIVDGTHPYATAVSETAMEVAKELNIQYLRFERSKVEFEENHSIIACESYAEIADYINEHQGNVLMTTGSNNLDFLSKVHEKDRVYVRVLPVAESIAKCRIAGIKPSRIIAMQGPFSLMLNKAFIEDKAIEILVTKESAEVGGFNEKLQAAQETGCTLVVLVRPRIQYENEMNDVEALVSYINENCDL